MKQIHYFNMFAVGLPITLCLLGLLDETFLFYGLVSTILTGLIQLIIGINMFIDEPKSRSLTIYLSSVVFFFLLWFLSGYTPKYSEELICILLAIPPILAIFLTIIIIKKMKK